MDDFSSILEKGLSKLAAKQTSMVVMPSKMALPVNLEVLKILQSHGYEGIWANFSVDYIQLVPSLKENNIDMAKIVFIDGISQFYGVKKVEAANVIYLAGPNKLSEIIEAIKHGANQLHGKKKFLLLNSITDLLLYSPLDSTVSFTNDLAKLVKSLNFIGLVASLSFDDNVSFQKIALVKSKK